PNATIKRRKHGIQTVHRRQRLGQPHGRMRPWTPRAIRKTHKPRGLDRKRHHDWPEKTTIHPQSVPWYSGIGMLFAVGISVEGGGQRGFFVPDAQLGRSFEFQMERG